MHFTFGEITVYPLEEGVFKLDGGQIFGVVPRLLWEKMYQPDDCNRIVLGIHPLLVQIQQKVLLLDTGIGMDFNRKFSEIYQIVKKPGLMNAIRHAGYEPEDIDIVINTHLHFDHAGGNTLRDTGGACRSAFPNAMYYVSEKELEAAKNVNERTKGSYREDDFLPLVKEERLILSKGEREVLPGVTIFPSPGHTAGHQSVRLESGGVTFVFLGDFIPMEAHLSPAYIAGIDLFPLDTLSEKKKFLKEAVSRRWLLYFYHDPRVKIGYPVEEEGIIRLVKKELIC